jgi:hypothetical protein
MTALGLYFVGEGGIVENLLEHSIKPEFLDLLRKQSNRCELEGLRDFIQNRFFRRDIYQKTVPGDTAATPDELMQQTLFGLVATPVQIPDSIHLTDAPGLHFQGAWFDRIKQLLAYKVLTLEEILADPILSTCTDEDLIEAVKLLTVGGFCAPFLTRERVPPRAPCETIKVVPKLNQVRLAAYDWISPSFTLASPVTGCGLSLNSLEAALLNALQRPDPIPWLWTELSQRGINLRTSDEKTTVEGEQKSLQALQQALDQFLQHKLPKLAYLGVVEPA